MRRAEWLIPYSHDHQHGLAQALRLRRAAEAVMVAGPDAAGDAEHALGTTAADALGFLRVELAPHMRREEVELLPLIALHGCTRSDEVARMTSEHLRLRVLHAQLADDPTDAAVAAELASLLHDHIRWEERELFEAWQARADRLPDTAMARLAKAAARDEPPLVACEAPAAPGSTGLAAGALNGTSVHVRPGGELPSARLDRDVALVVTGGTGKLLVDDAERALSVGLTLIMRAGSTRSIHAGADGLGVTTVHVRR